MYYNVIVKKHYIDDDGQNLLVFTFYDMKEALDFAKQILNISDYHIEILQFEKEQGE